MILLSPAEKNRDVSKTTHRTSWILRRGLVYLAEVGKGKRSICLFPYFPCSSSSGRCLPFPCFQQMVWCGDISESFFRAGSFSRGAKSDGMETRGCLLNPGKVGRKELSCRGLYTTYAPSLPIASSWTSLCLFLPPSFRSLPCHIEVCMNTFQS